MGKSRGKDASRKICKYSRTTRRAQKKGRPRLRREDSEKTDEGKT